MTVYEILVDVIEIMMVWILVLPFVIMAYFVLRKGYLPQEIINEILIIAAGLIIPLAILHTIFGGLQDWSQGHTDGFRKTPALSASKGHQKSNAVEGRKRATEEAGEGQG